MTHIALAESLISRLSPYYSQWALPSLSERRERRLTSTIEELRAFHNAVLPHLHDVLTVLNSYPLSDMPEEHRPLSYLALMMCEVDDAVTKWKSPTLSEAVDPRHFVIKQNFYDIGPMGASAGSAR